MLHAGTTGLSASGPGAWMLIDADGGACYGSLSPLVDKVLSTRLVFELDLRRTSTADI